MQQFKNLEDGYLSFLKIVAALVIARTRGSKLKMHQLLRRARRLEKK